MARAPLPPILQAARLPVIGAPMFILSTPALVIAQCKAGIIGAMPALNARPSAQLDEWLHEIREALSAWDAANPDRPAAPFAINQIIFRTNDRLEADMAICEKHKVPIVISSLGAREDVNVAVHRWRGLVLHDVTDDRFARKAIEKGADGLVAVAAGAGGHAGQLSPFALIEEIRQWFDGPLALAGAIATGRAIRAAQVMGADFAYMGSAFIATTEANAPEAYKQAIVGGRASDIVYTDLFTGISANYLRQSIVASGLDPDNLPSAVATQTGLSSGAAKAWKDIWGAGQGIGGVAAVLPVAARVDQLASEYRAACELPAWTTASLEIAQIRC